MNMREKAQKTEGGLEELSSKAFLSAKDICRLLGIKRYALSSAIKSGAIPKPIQLSKRLRRWKASEFYAWMDKTAEE